MSYPFRVSLMFHSWRRIRKFYYFFWRAHLHIANLPTLKIQPEAVRRIQIAHIQIAVGGGLGWPHEVTPGRFQRARPEGPSLHSRARKGVGVRFFNIGERQRRGICSSNLRYRVTTQNGPLDPFATLLPGLCNDGPSGLMPRLRRSGGLS